MDAASPGAPAIEAVGLSRRFGDCLALEALDLRIPVGATFGLLGPNGAGKTTFIRLVAGLLLPSGGTLSVGGRSPASEPSEVQRSLGFVTETSRLYPELRVRGFLRFAAGARGLSGQARESAVAREVLRFDLASVLDRSIGQLSKGFQQRVSLAQAFLHDPPLVVVDEPTGGLDPLQRVEVHALLRELRGDRTLLLCTHDLDEARALTESVAVLGRGRLVAEGPTHELLDEATALSLFRPGGATG